MSSDELARAARELLAAASDPIRFPISTVGDETVSMTPTPHLNELRHALEPHPEPSPFVSVNPKMKSGQPCLNGRRISAGQIADMYWDMGESLEAEILSQYAITRADVVVCCWYVSEYGTRAQRKRWEDWQRMTWENTGRPLDSDVGTGWWSPMFEDVPLPPTRQQAAEVRRS